MSKPYEGDQLLAEKGRLADEIQTQEATSKMILVTSDIKKKFPKAFSAARKERFRVVWLRDDLIYCARKAKGHGDYIVRVFATPSVNGGHQVKLQCKSITGEACDGVYWGKGCCAHIASVLLRTEKKPDKKQRKEAA